MDQQRRGAPFRLLPHVQPQVVEEHHVGAEFFFRASVARRAHDVAAGNPGAVGLQNPLQAETFVVARDLARDADVIDGRHVHQEAAGQRDVRSDARAFLTQRLLGDLDDDFLAFFQQVADRRQRHLFPAGIRARFRTRLPACPPDDPRAFLPDAARSAVPFDSPGCALRPAADAALPQRARDLPALGPPPPGPPVRVLRGLFSGCGAKRDAGSASLAHAAWPSGWWECAPAPDLRPPPECRLPRLPFRSPPPGRPRPRLPLPARLRVPPRLRPARRRSPPSP